MQWAVTPHRTREKGKDNGVNHLNNRATHSRKASTNQPNSNSKGTTRGDGRVIPNKQDSINHP